ncbi:MAG: CocE/NonD family hydrolase [Sedimentisphaerales bacterium]
MGAFTAFAEIHYSWYNAHQRASQNFRNMNALVRYSGGHNMTQQRAHQLVFAILLFCHLPICLSAETPGEELKVVIDRNVPVPMRDGTILRADVWRPDRGGPYPVLVMRTPYGKNAYGNFDRFVKAGYIVVSQDVRGRYQSEGKWVSLFRFQTQEAEDGYDTVEWAARLPNSTGKVGTFGYSYPAFLQWCLAPLRPPALVVMSACSNPAKIWDLSPSTIRPGTRLVWWDRMACDMRLKENIPGVHCWWERNLLWKEGFHKWIYWLPWLELPQDFFGYEAQAVKSWLANPHVDPWSFDEGCKDITVPNLDIVGWYDEYHGDMLLFRAMAKDAATETARKGSKIIVGPWSHNTIGRSRIAPFEFGPDAALDLTSTRVHWFDYWLKGKQNGVDKEAPVRIFVMGDNKWRDEQNWPLQRSKDKIFYITSDSYANTPRGDGRLIVEKKASTSFDNYNYDPSDPVPTLKEELEPADQRPLTNRQDILVYQTAPLDDRIEVTGYPEVELYAASSAPDTDWFVTLIDVAPDGLARDVSFGMVRARYREGFDKPKLIVPNRVVKYTIIMRPTSNAFLPGHRIRLDITSSDFPNYDRNHNTAVNQNGDATLVVAQQTIYHGGERASLIILPWVPTPPEEEKSAEKEEAEEGPVKEIHALYQAVANGDIEQIRILISKGVDVNAQDEAKFTPLHYAAKSGMAEITQLLLEAGAGVDVEAADKEKTPLHYAAEAGNKEVVKLLVEAGADINHKGTYDWPPLCEAIEENNIAVVEYLIAHGVDINAAVNAGALWGAARFSDIEMIKLLIANGADINADPFGTVYAAVERRRRDIVEFLIKNGADINLERSDGATALSKAIQRGYLDMARLLIENGADIKAKDNGVALLGEAISTKNKEIAELLLANGVDVNIEDSLGNTPLDYAISRGMEDIARLLVEKGAEIADVGSKDDRGLTALHNAAVEGYQEIAEILLSKGAKVDERDDNYEFTALHYAARFGTTKVAEVLIAHGADIKAKDKWAYEPIHWAAYHDRSEIIELLIAKGADVNVKTSLGQSPLELAIPMRNMAAMQILRKQGAEE